MKVSYSTPLTPGHSKIGILIPAYNEELVIKGTIDALQIAGCLISDIYIVNDRSTDKTEEICHSLGLNIYTVPENGGKAKAQVAAFEHFRLLEKYDWLIFLDGDTKVDKNFLLEMENAVKNDSSIALYLGQVKSVKNDHLFSASRAYDYTYGQEIAKTGQHNFGVVFVAPGCASMYKTEVLKKLHIDHLTLAEDMDLTMQVHRVGERVAYVPKAIVNTQDPGTFNDYHKQILRWYRGFWQVVKKHSIFSLVKKKQRVDLYMILITLDAVLFNRILWLAIIAIMYPKALPTAVGMDLVIAMFISLCCAIKAKRADIVYKFPAYYWISYLNFYAYMRSFIEIIVLRKTILSWNKVKRYDFDGSNIIKM